MKNILKRIGLIAVAVFVAVGSIFTFKSSKNDNSFLASANSSVVNYSFEGSNLLLVSKTTRDAMIPLSVQFTLNSYTSNSVLLDIFCYAEYNGSGAYLMPSGFLDSYPIQYSTTDVNYPISDDMYSIVVDMYYRFGHYGDSTEIFNCNVAYVEIGWELIGSAYNYIRYVDVNGNYLNFSFPMYSMFEFQHRIYYLDSAYSDNDFYLQGLSDGYNNGYSVGESVGYNNGFSAGEIQGFIAGRQDGIETGADGRYTFLGLIGAVVDAPLQAFQGLFNFELLGVNLFGFFTGLFTFCAIIIIVKFAVGGK